MKHGALHPPGHGPEMLQEHWILHFCDKPEKEQLLMWLRQEGLERPRLFADRLAHAEKLRGMSNKWYKAVDYRRALHCIMGAVHALDWPPAEQVSFSKEQTAEVAQAMLPVMSNAAMIFLKRGDFGNAIIAASAGLKVAGKLPAEETQALRAKLLWRRGIARGEEHTRDLDEALKDLKEAAQLEPQNQEIRECLANCKAAWRDERKNDPLRYRPSGQSHSDPAGDPGDRAAEEPEDAAPARPELSAGAERFARVVGTSLGRAARYGRRVRQACRDRPAASVGAVALPVLGVLVAVVANRFA